MRFFRRMLERLGKRPAATAFDQWLQANVVRGERHLTPLFALYRDYCTWCASRGELPMTGSFFANAMGCSRGAFDALGWKPMYVRGALRHA